MKSGAIVTAIVVSVALCGVTLAFLSNASPYVTVSEARKMSSGTVHLKADFVPGSVVNDVRSGVLKFKVKDATGETTVVYKGAPPNNIADATSVVAIGQMQSEEFHSEKLLIKCPSKYEGGEKATDLLPRS